MLMSQECLEDQQKEVINHLNISNGQAVKWLIGLAAGVIVFTFNGLSSQIFWFQKIPLLIGWGLLIFSIFQGVSYVRLYLSFFDLKVNDLAWQIDIKKHLLLDASSEHQYRKEGQRKIQVMKSAEILEYCRKQLEGVLQRKLEINWQLHDAFVAQGKFFIYGLISIAVYGLFRVLCL